MRLTGHTLGEILANLLSLSTSELSLNTWFPILWWLLMVLTLGTSTSYGDDWVSKAFVRITNCITLLSSCIWHAFSACTILFEHFSLATAWFSFYFTRYTSSFCLILFKAFLAWLTISIYSCDKFLEQAFISEAFQFSILWFGVRWAVLTSPTIVWKDLSWGTVQFWHNTFPSILVWNKTKLAVITLSININELVKRALIRCTFSVLLLGSGELRAFNTSIILSRIYNSCSNTLIEWSLRLLLNYGHCWGSFWLLLYDVWHNWRLLNWWLLNLWLNYLWLYLWLLGWRGSYWWLLYLHTPLW